MGRFAHLSRRQRLGVLLAWAALVVAAMPLASHQLDRLTSGGFEVRASQSGQAERIARAQFPTLTEERLMLMLRGRPGATPLQYRAALRRFAAAVRGDRRIALQPGAEDSALGAGANASVALLPLEVHATVRETIDRASELRSELGMDSQQSGPVTIQLVGRAAQVAAVHAASELGVKDAERLGFPLVLVILLVVFGSLTAALLPLLVGISSVVLTGALIYLLSGHFVMSMFVVNVASMIGIGVAVDYSLFLLARYREEIAAGHSEGRALEAMLATSGHAVVFAGSTVVVSLATMFLLDNTILRSIAAGAMIVVTIAVLVTVTAMPALVGLLGHRLHAPSRPLAALGARLRALGPLRRRDGGARPFWERWTERVMAHRVLSAVGATAVLLTLSIPVLDLALGVDTVRQLPRDDPARQAAETAVRTVRARPDSPVVITATARTGAPDRRAVRGALTHVLTADKEIAQVLAAHTTANGRTVLVAGIPWHAPESEAGLRAVRRIRGATSRLSRQLPGWRIAVGGTSATIVDAADQISSNLWKVVLTVLLLSFVVLLVLLRSVVLPLKAIVMNLLTVGAATGVLVVVFQWGWFDRLGVESLGHIEIYVPPLIFAVVYGLSMDYEIFLLTRIRERYEATGDNWSAVAQGVASSARVVTSAALIMVAVFSIFIATNIPIVQEIGLGTAVAIALDATLTRLVLLPATMALLGDLNWWMPSRLARVVERRRVPSRA